MRYLLCILCPPLAVLLCGKPLTAVLNVLLTICFWIPGMIHAFAVVSTYFADQRAARLEYAIRRR